MVWLYAADLRQIRHARHRPRLGIAHPLATGAQRLIDGITDPTLRSGTFYASAANTITGPVIDQAEIFGDLAKPTYQHNANQAIHRFTGVGGTVS